MNIFIRFWHKYSFEIVCTEMFIFHQILVKGGFSQLNLQKCLFFQWNCINIFSTNYMQNAIFPADLKDKSTFQQPHQTFQIKLRFLCHIIVENVLFQNSLCRNILFSSDFMQETLFSKETLEIGPFSLDFGNKKPFLN